MNDFYASPDLSDGFGAEGPHRRNPHRGLDFIYGWGTPIPSLGDGVVTISEYSAELGWITEIAGDDGMYPGYRHQASRGLPVGTRVEAGQIIGYVGDTGRASTGPHLCLTIGTGPGAVYGVPSLVIDPWPYICSLTPKPPAPPAQEENSIMSTIYARATVNSSPTTPGDDASSRIWAGDPREADGPNGAKFSGVWAIESDTGTARRLTTAEWRIVDGAYRTAGLTPPVADVHGNDIEVLIYGPQLKK